MSENIEENLKKYGYIYIKPKGTSMFPTIRGKNTVVKIDAIKEPVKVYDVVVYKRENNSLIMHRILKIDGDNCTCCGDNQWFIENISQKQIIGKMVLWNNKNKSHSVEDKYYIKFVKFWCKSLKLRHFILILCNKYCKIKYFLERK